MNNYNQLLKDITYECRWWPLTFFLARDNEIQINQLMNQFTTLNENDQVFIFTQFKQHRFKLLKTTQTTLFNLLPSFFTAYRLKNLNTLTTALKIIRAQLNAEFQKPFIDQKEDLRQEYFDEFLDHPPTEQDLAWKNGLLHNSEGNNYFYWYDYTSKKVQRHVCDHSNISTLKKILNLSGKLNAQPYEGNDPVIQWTDDTQVKKEKKLLYVNSQGNIEYYKDKQWQNLNYAQALEVGGLEKIKEGIRNFEDWKLKLKCAFGSSLVNYSLTFPSEPPVNSFSYFIRPCNNRRLEVELFLPVFVNGKGSWTSQKMSGSHIDKLEKDVQAIITLRNKAFLANLATSFIPESISVTQNHIELKGHHPTPVGMEPLSISLIYSGLADEEISRELNLPPPCQMDTMFWKEQALHLHDYCAAKKILWIENSSIDPTSLQVQFISKDSWPLPQIFIVIKDKDGKLQKLSLDSLPISSLDTSTFIKGCQILEIKHALSVLDNKYPYIKTKMKAEVFFDVDDEENSICTFQYTDFVLNKVISSRSYSIRDKGKILSEMVKAFETLYPIGQALIKIEEAIGKYAIDISLRSKALMVSSHFFECEYMYSKGVTKDLFNGEEGFKFIDEDKILEQIKLLKLEIDLRDKLFEAFSKLKSKNAQNDKDQLFFNDETVDFYYFDPVEKKEKCLTNLDLINDLDEIIKEIESIYSKINLYYSVTEKILDTFNNIPKKGENLKDKIEFDKDVCRVTIYDPAYAKSITTVYNIFNDADIATKIGEIYKSLAFLDFILFKTKTKVSRNFVTGHSLTSRHIRVNLEQFCKTKPTTKGYLVVARKNTQYQITYWHPSRPYVLLNYPIDTIEQIDSTLNQLDFDIALLNKFKTSKLNVFNTASTHVDITVPDEIPGISIQKIKDDFDMINFTDPTSPNYLSPSNIGINTANQQTASEQLNKFLQKAQEKMAQFYDHLADPTKLHFDKAEQEKCAKTLKNLLTNIIHKIDQEPDHKTRLLQISQVVLAICYCDTKWMMALMDQHALLSGVLEGASLEDCNVLQVAHSWVDAVKYARYNAMAAEIYQPESANEAAVLKQIGHQQEHHKKWILSTLSKNGHKIPLADVADFKDFYGTHAEYCNYKTEKEVLGGYEDGFIVALVHDFHEKLQAAFKTDMKMKISAEVKDRIAHYLKHLAKAPEKLMLSVHQEKFGALLPALIETLKIHKEAKLKKIQAVQDEISDPASASERCSIIRNELLQQSEDKLVTELTKSGWSLDEIELSTQAYIQSVRNDPTTTSDEKVIKQLIDEFLEHSSASVLDPIALSSLFNEFAASVNAIFKQEDSVYLDIYKKERIIEINKSTQVNLSVALQEIAEKMGLFTEDEDTGAITSISLEGSFAAVYGFGFAETI